MLEQPEKAAPEALRLGDALVIFEPELQFAAGSAISSHRIMRVAAIARADEAQARELLRVEARVVRILSTTSSVSNSVETPRGRWICRGRARHAP